MSKDRVPSKTGYLRATHNCATCKRPQVSFKGVDFCTVIDHNRSARSYQTANGAWTLPNECPRCKGRSYARKWSAGEETRKCNTCGTKWSWRLKSAVADLLKLPALCQSTPKPVSTNKPVQKPVPAPRLSLQQPNTLPAHKVSKCPTCDSRVIRYYSGENGKYTVECLHKACGACNEINPKPRIEKPKFENFQIQVTADGTRKIIKPRPSPQGQEPPQVVIPPVKPSQDETVKVVPIVPIKVYAKDDQQPSTSRSGHRVTSKTPKSRPKGPAITPKSEPTNTFKQNSLALDEVVEKVLPNGSKRDQLANDRLVAHSVEQLKAGEVLLNMRKQIAKYLPQAPLAKPEDFHLVRTLFPSKLTIVTDKRRCRVQVPEMNHLSHLKYAVLAAISTNKLEELPEFLHSMARVIMSHRLKSQMRRKGTQRRAALKQSPLKSVNTA